MKYLHCFIYFFCLAINCHLPYCEQDANGNIVRIINGIAYVNGKKVRILEVKGKKHSIIPICNPCVHTENSFADFNEFARHKGYKDFDELIIDYTKNNEQSICFCDCNQLPPKFNLSVAPYYIYSLTNYANLMIFQGRIYDNSKLVKVYKIYDKRLGRNIPIAMRCNKQKHDEEKYDNLDKFAQSEGFTTFDDWANNLDDKHKPFTIQPCKCWTGSDKIGLGLIFLIIGFELLLLFLVSMCEHRTTTYLSPSVMPFHTYDGAANYIHTESSSSSDEDD
jgi:hypothetical protein